MKTLAKRRAVPPTLRSLEDLKRGPVDLEKVFNLSTLYALTIDNSLQETIDRQGVFHPSAVGMCKRSQVLGFLRTPPSDHQSKRVKEIFKLGHVIHDLIQSALERIPAEVSRVGLQAKFERETPCDRNTDSLYLDFGIAGTCDGILRVWNEDFEQRGTVEIKSAGDEKFKELKPDEHPGFINHLMQAHLYAFRFDTPLVYLFYYGKNSSQRIVKTSAFSWEIFEKAVAYFDECNRYVTRGELPPREESYFECKDCVFRTMCDPIILRSKHSSPSLLKAVIRRKAKP